jgi:hypothetical protein
MSQGRMIVLTKTAPGREAEFNRWYDEVHVPEVLSVGPVTACQRFKISDAQMMPQEYQYLAIYEFEGGAKEALDALMAASGSMQMSDALLEPNLCMVEALGPRVTKPAHGSTRK